MHWNYTASSPASTSIILLAKLSGARLPDFQGEIGAGGRVTKILELYEHYALPTASADLLHYGAGSSESQALHDLLPRPPSFSAVHGVAPPADRATA
jgi:hypothetical protein